MRELCKLAVSYSTHSICVYAYQFVLAVCVQHNLHLQMPEYYASECGLYLYNAMVLLYILSVLSESLNVITFFVTVLVECRKIVFNNDALSIPELQRFD